MAGPADGDGNAQRAHLKSQKLEREYGRLVAHVAMDRVALDGEHARRSCFGLRHRPPGNVARRAGASSARVVHEKRTAKSTPK